MKDEIIRKERLEGQENAVLKLTQQAVIKELQRHIQKAKGEVAKY